MARPPVFLRKKPVSFAKSKLHRFRFFILNQEAGVMCERGSESTVRITFPVDFATEDCTSRSAHRSAQWRGLRCWLRSNKDPRDHLHGTEGSQIRFELMLILASHERFMAALASGREREPSLRPGPLL